MLEVFLKKRNGDVRRKAEKAYEDECRRLIDVVEHLTEQRKESVDIIRLVNKGLGDLICSLQKKNPQNENAKSIPDELLNTISAQLLSSIQAQLEGELLDDESDAFVSSHNEANDENVDCVKVKRCDDDGLKTELVILQSQMNRLRTEQDKLTINVEQKQHKSANGHGESSSHAHRRIISNSSFNLSKESLTDSDMSGINTGKDDDTYRELIKKQEKEINRLRQKIKIYEDQFKEYTSSISGATGGSHVNGLTNGVNGINEGVKDEFKKLQRSFHTFTSVSGDEVEIDKDAANTLLELYQLGPFQDNSKSSKMRLAAALEARISSQLCEQVEGYFAGALKDTYLEEDYDDNNLELDLVTTTEKLVELLNRFADARANGDESLDKTCTKLRSLIYSSLSPFSFSTSEIDTHPFISSLVLQLLKFMEEYRTLPSTVFPQVKEEAKQIILEFISLVHFKLKSLESQPKLFYYEQGANVDEHKMKGAWDKSNVSNQEVEICYFPAVIVDQNNTQTNTISKAQVLTRCRYKPS